MWTTTPEFNVFEDESNIGHFTYDTALLLAYCLNLGVGEGTVLGLPLVFQSLLFLLHRSGNQNE